jgi:site-specific DNA-methyltransferase (adenine-specific)
MDRYSLYNDDCLHILKSMGSESVDLLLTDPPYGINFQSGRQKIDRKQSIAGNTSAEIRDFYFDPISNDAKLNLDWLKEGYRVLKKDSAMYVFCHWKKWHLLYQECENIGFTVKNMIILNKSNHGSGDLKGSYAPKHEILLFASKGKHKLNFPNKRDNDVWNVPVKFSGSIKKHPNEKPASWIEKAIENSSGIDSLVLDPFMGAGTFGKLAVTMKRRFIGIEIDKHYFDIAESQIKESIKDFIL